MLESGLHIHLDLKVGCGKEENSLISERDTTE